MEITVKDIEKNLKTLPKELLEQVNEYVEFLKEISSTKRNIPQWQIDEVIRRKKDAEENPENLVSEDEMNKFLNELEDEN